MAWLARRNDDEILALFEQSGRNAQRASALLREMIAEYPERAELARDVLLCEQEGDRIAHDIIYRLHEGTGKRAPFESTNVYHLATAAGRHRGLRRGDRRPPGPVRDRGADGAGGHARRRARRRRRPGQRGAARSAQRPRALGQPGRDPPARERGRPLVAATRWPRCSPTASTRWWSSAGRTSTSRSSARSTPARPSRTCSRASPSNAAGAARPFSPPLARSSGLAVPSTASPGGWAVLPSEERQAMA